MLRNGFIVLIASSALSAVSACGGSSEGAPDAGGSLDILTDELPEASRDVPYEVELNAAGGVPPYSWAASDLPAGLVVDGGGRISGTATETGTYEVAVTVSDAAGDTKTAALALIVNADPAIKTDELPLLHVFRRYEADIEVLGGTPPYSFAASGLPGGLVIDAETGRIENDPDAPAITSALSGTVTITVTDDAASTAVAQLALSAVGIASIVGGSGHTCALDEQGGAWCWGVDDDGQLGNDEQNDSVFVPTPVAGDHAFTSLTAGSRHVCGLDDEGAAHCWGLNDKGQLGNGNEGEGEQSEVPSAVAGDLVFSSISAGAVHTCALDADGAAYCWGANSFGQLGNDDEGQDSPVPAAVAGDRAYSSIAGGLFHTCALDEAGAAFCWGSNLSGQLGDDNEGVDSPVPVAVEGGRAFELIATTGDHTCAVDADGAAFCWGRNPSGELGNDDEGQDSAIPVAVAGDHAFAAITTGDGHTCAIDGDAAGWCWGRNDGGQLGDDGNGQDRPVPVAVAGDLELASIAAGRFHSCAIDDSATGWCWGSNFGQLGDGTNEDRHVPVPVHPGE